VSILLQCWVEGIRLCHNWINTNDHSDQFASSVELVFGNRLDVASEDVIIGTAPPHAIVSGNLRFDIVNVTCNLQHLIYFKASGWNMLG
jgi:hypothetical protein